jgi:hypothetical protein
MPTAWPLAQKQFDFYSTEAQGRQPDSQGRNDPLAIERAPPLSQSNSPAPKRVYALMLAEAGTE